MKKYLLLFVTMLMSVGMYAATVVTITEADFPSEGYSFTKDGVTITSGNGFDDTYNLWFPTFTSSVGNFTKIEISAGNVALTGEGWSDGNTWTGNASSVSTDGDSYALVFYESITITCTIEEPEPEPEPAEVTVVFAANSKTVERTVTLPHEFLCSYYNGNGELDAIIQELYGISAGHCSDYNYPVASGNEAVSAGSYGYENYITISAAFEGTATVSGSYWNWDAYDGDGDWMDYSLTISIKGDESEPQETVVTLTLASNDETMGTVKALGGAGGVRETIILKNKGAEDPIQGEYFQVSGGGTDNFGRYIGKTDGYSLTISSLNGEMIDSISFSVTATSMWSGYTVSSTSGEVVDHVFGNYTFKVKNINATSVTINRIGDGDPSGFITVDVVYVNQDIPVRAEITDMEFPTSGNTLTINDMTLTVGSFDLNTPKITGGGTFTTDLGEFTAISIYSYGFDGFAGEGWTGDMYTQRWTGQSSSVSFEGMVFGDGVGSIAITYTIVPAPAATAGIVDNGDGTYTVTSGTEVMLVAEPAEGYHLASWSNDAALNDDGTQTITITDDIAITAVFAADEPESQETVVVLTEADFDGIFFAKDGVILEMYSVTQGIWNLMAPGTLTNSLGKNFTKVEVTPTGGDVVISGEGWSGDWGTMIWTGNAASVSINGEGIYGKGDGFTITCTLEDAATGVENAQADEAQTAKARKFFRNGKLFIKKNDEIYTVAGARVE